MNILFLDALLAQTLLILSLQLCINLGTLGGGVAVQLGLYNEHIRHTFSNHFDKNENSDILPA